MRDTRTVVCRFRKNGEEVFRDTQAGHEPLMESFGPDDAKAFAKKAREARAKLPH